MPWVLYHARPHRVEFDIPRARHEVRLGLHRARPVASFPQGPGAAVCRVDIVDVPTTNRLHDLGNAVRVLWRHEQVNVIGHQDIRMYRRRVPRGGVEACQVETIIVLMEEDRLPIMPALDTGKLERVFIWGSYVTAKPDPGDVDLFLVMTSDFESHNYKAKHVWCSIAPPPNAC